MGISVWQLLIVLAILVLLFGTKKLRGLGTDLGAAVKGFKGAMKDGTEGKEEAEADAEADTQKLEQGDEATASEASAATAQPEAAKVDERKSA